MATDIGFPEGFLWGTATAAHQVEGNNTNSDWWEWERRPGTPVTEPSADAIDHYRRAADDVALLADLGFNAYRYSVEWARVEPSDGTFDADHLRHYREMTEAVIAAGLTPIVTLNHFTLPLWLAKRGGWRCADAPSLFSRYCDTVVRSLGAGVRWYCTINEPGVVAFGGYLGAFGFPPGTQSYRAWQQAIAGLVEGHRLGRVAVKLLRPEAMVGATHSMQEWEANGAARALLDFMRRMNEDVFLEASAKDDFLGIQTYTRQRVALPGLLGPVVSAALRTHPGRRTMTEILRRMARRRSGLDGGGVTAPSSGRTTQMGYEFRPEAVAATVRRASALLPGKPMVVTEHGIATDDDSERIEFIRGGLQALHRLVGEGVDLRGYVYWSAFDNFEWARGYAMRFGLIGVDRGSMVRSIKPSGRFLGEVARTNRLPLDGA